MKSEDVTYFRNALEDLAEEITRDLSSKSPSSESITPDNAIGRLTRMEAIQAQSISAESRRQRESRLKSTRRALELLDSGEYGKCVRCGTEILRGRLEFRPESLLCIRCAGKR